MSMNALPREELLKEVRTWMKRILGASRNLKGKGGDIDINIEKEG